jgi:hypothetical protein
MEREGVSKIRRDHDQIEDRYRASVILRAENRQRFVITK